MILEILGALQKGEEVKNSVSLKKWQMATNGIAAAAIGGVQVAEAFGVSLPVNSDSINQMSGAIGSLLMFGNVFFTAMSSKKVGF